MMMMMMMMMMSRKSRMQSSYILPHRDLGSKGKIRNKGAQQSRIHMTRFDRHDRHNGRLIRGPQGCLSLVSLSDRSIGTSRNCLRSRLLRRMSSVILLYIVEFLFLLLRRPSFGFAVEFVYSTIGCFVSKQSAVVTEP